MTIVYGLAQNVIMSDMRPFTYCDSSVPHVSKYQPELIELAYRGFSGWPDACQMQSTATNV